MAYTTINKSSDYFNTKLYTGTGSTQSITSVGFQPDMNWHKTRTRTGYNHCIVDSVRGATKLLKPNLDQAENTVADSLTSFDTDGFTLGADASNGETNKSGDNYASWNWKANGAGSANTVGSVSSTVSVNATSGFSIVSWQGTDANASVGHGLSKAPTMVFYKTRGLGESWVVYNKQIGAGNKLILNDTSASSSSSTNFQNGLDPNNSVFYVGANATNKNTPMIAYCFTDVQGYSKIGSYTGNGNADGTFVYTGFKPAFVMIKRTDTTDNWKIIDNRRIGYNGGTYFLDANRNVAEETTVPAYFDILSNGFKARNSWSPINASGGTYIYMAFASAPLVGTNNVPCTAR